MLQIDHKFTRRQRGIAALELALILPVFLILLTFPLYLGRVLWHYTVIERAAQDAALYLSTVPLSEMKNPARAPAVAAVANAIVSAELAELRPGPDPIPVTIVCDIGACAGFTAPATVSVTIQLRMTDILFPDETSLILPLTASITYPYIGI